MTAVARIDLQHGTAGGANSFGVERRLLIAFDPIEESTTTTRDEAAWSAPCSQSASAPIIEP
jgi:hypothetical protein